MAFADYIYNINTNDTEFDLTQVIDIECDGCEDCACWECLTIKELEHTY